MYVVRLFLGRHEHTTAYPNREMMTDEHNCTIEGSFFFFIVYRNKNTSVVRYITKSHPPCPSMSGSSPKLTHTSHQLNSVLFRELRWSQPPPDSVACLEVSLQSFGLGSKGGSVSAPFEGLTEAFELFASCVLSPSPLRAS